MRKIASLALLATLAGCASSPYGNFAENTSTSINQALVTDTVKQLVAVYPPARTRFKLIHETPDAYGRALVASLRAKGYSLEEFNPQDSKQVAEVQKSGSTTGLAMNYIIDITPENNLYRVTVRVGYQSLTRGYIAQSNTVYPAGAWTRKE